MATLFFITTLIFGNLSIFLFYKWKDERKTASELRNRLEESKQMNKDLLLIIKP